MKMQFCLLNQDQFNLRTPAFYNSDSFRFHTEVRLYLFFSALSETFNHPGESLSSEPRAGSRVSKQAMHLSPVSASQNSPFPWILSLSLQQSTHLLSWLSFSSRNPCHPERSPCYLFTQSVLSDSFQKFCVPGSLTDMVVYGACTGLKRQLLGGWGVTPQLDGVGSEP